MELVKVSKIFTYLTSSQHNNNELNNFLLSKMSVFRKISRDRKFGEKSIDKTADILKRFKSTQSKLYNNCIRRYFMMIKHPNLSSRMRTVFHHGYTYSENRVSQILDDEEIKNNTMLAGIRNLSNFNLPISLKKPSH